MSIWKADMLSSVILVVDDVPGNRAILCRRLSRAGYNCAEAESGEAALDWLRGHTPDIILLDYMMPEMSGIDMLRIVRSDERTANIPVIMVTARTEGVAIAEALDAGAEDYVTKPIDFTSLQARIQSVLQRTHKHSEIRKINQVLDNRVLMRSLELAEMHEELACEKGRTTKLREEIAHCNAAPVCIPACRERTLDMLSRIDRLAATLMGHAAAGQPLNLSLLADIRATATNCRENIVSPEIRRKSRG